MPRVHVRQSETGPELVEEDHLDWLLVQQDCDLAWNAVASSGSLIELRPVFQHDPPQDWGIRSSRLRLDGVGYIHAEAPGIRVTPDVVFAARHISCPTDSAALRLKKWLGLRYDRPAIPQQYVGAAKALAAQLSKPRHKQIAGRVRDVLATFRQDADGALGYRLVAVLPRDEVAADPGLLQLVRTWLAEVALTVPQQHGYAVSLDAYADDQVSLAFLESSYSLDVTNVSWPNREPGPIGAVGA